MIRAFGQTGIRVSELQFITVESIQQQEITIRNKNKNRKVPLIRELQEMLNDYVIEKISHLALFSLIKIKNHWNGKIFIICSRPLLPMLALIKGSHIPMHFATFSPNPFMTRRMIWSCSQIFQDIPISTPQKLCYRYVRRIMQRNGRNRYLIISKSAICIKGSSEIQLLSA